MRSLFLKNYLVYAVAGILSLVVLITLTLPTVHFRLGTVFFGGVPELYNASLAEYFYTYAAYPLYGEAPEFAHYQLSRVYFIKGAFYTSANEALKELEMYPENKRTYYILGLTYGYMDKEVEAIEAFSNFIDAYPESWAARNDKAWLQFRIGDIAGALETMEPVREFRNPWVQNTIGTLLLNSGDKDAARSAFLLAQEITNEMTEASWGIAYPGNDPRIYQVGLESMRASISANLALVEEKE